ncbi:MAG: M50 family metallopeptidase [Armatimonadetes bacterium]|nr:M50 family metallopeptidase [Armatimonadota bacterium]
MKHAVLSSATGRALLLSIAVTLLLYLVPYGDLLAYPLLLISTVAHEMGHGFTAQLLGGSFHSFSMSADGSGVASYSGNLGRLGAAMVAAGGLIGPAFVAALCFLLARTERGARGALVAAGVFLLIAEVLVVRGGFGWFFVGLLGATLLGIGLRAEPRAGQTALVFLAVQLSLSVFSRSDYLFATHAGPMPSDVAQMAQALWLPYWFWGLVCGGVSLAILAAGVGTFLRRV